MNRNNLLCAAFGLAAACFAAGTVNHALNTGEGVLSSALLALGCLCLAFAYYKKHGAAFRKEQDAPPAAGRPV